MASRICAVVLLALASSLPAQDLVFSLTADIPASPFPWRKEEVLRYSPAGGTRTALPREAWNLMVGDRDGNGTFDDAPANLDALDTRGSGAATDWLYSIAANITLANGFTIRDGDVFRFDGLGGVVIAWSEDLFAQATSTSTIDVDAIAIGPNGQIYFSFEEDETTTDPALISANGGSAILDEQTVFRLDPGQTVATIRLTQAQVAAIFSQALGTTVTTVVDVVGLEIDPLSPADLLLTSASTSQALRGRIVSSRGGGQVFQTSAGAFDPAQLGLGSTVSLDAIALLAAPAFPVMRTSVDSGSVSGGGAGSVSVENLAPGQNVQLIVTEPVLPGPHAWTSAQTIGFGMIVLDQAYPMFSASFMVSAWQLQADAAGVARFTWNFLGLPANRTAVTQAITTDTLSVSSPVAVAFLP